MDDVVSMAKLASARCVFFNGCDSAMLANHAVRNGVACAIYTTADLADRDAWKFPMLWYEQLARQEDENVILDLRKAFEQSVDRSGFYGWSSNGLYERSLLSPLVEEIGKVYEVMADHTERMNGRLMVYESQLHLFERYIRSVFFLGGGALLVNTLLMMAHFYMTGG